MVLMVHIFTSSVSRSIVVDDPLLIFLVTKHNKLTDTITFIGRLMHLIV